MSDKPITKKILKKELNAGLNSLEKKLVRTLNKTLSKAFQDFWVQVLEPNLATKVELKEAVTGLENKIDKNSNLIRQNHREIQGIKADLSNTPTRKEFNKLEAKVNLHHPTVS